MRAVIYYHSMFGNGERMSSLLTEELRKFGMSAEMFKLSQKPVFEAADLVIFSSPTHASDAVRKMKKFIANIPDNHGCYALMTSYGYDLPYKTLDTMSASLDAKKMNKVEDLAVKVKGLRGPLPDDIHDLMRDFAEKLHIGCQAKRR